MTGVLSIGKISLRPLRERRVNDVDRRKDKMKTIKFSHIYTKLLDEHNDVIEYATLIDVHHVDLVNIHQKFKDYDTDNGLSQLPPKGIYLMLTFLKPPESDGTSAANLFTTLRRSTVSTDKYYYGAIGEAFLIDVQKLS
jgi:hypothetical protein